MSWPITFAGLSTAPMSDLDTMFNAAGALGTVQCAATGTNTITLTPVANTPPIPAYGTGSAVRFGFSAAATSTGPVGGRVNALPIVNVYLPSGVQADANDIASGGYYEVVYLAALNSNAGGLLIVSAIPASSAAPVALAAVRGLKIINNAGTPSTKIDITATKAVLTTTTGTPIQRTAVTVTIDLATTGANGMDTGARPTSGWVYLYLISNGAATAGIATTTAPASGSFSPVPTGYVYSGFVGAMYCDGSQNLLRTRQFGKEASYVVTAATNTANLPFIGTGSAGDPTVPTWVALAVGAFVPATASIIKVSAASSDNIVIAAPNNAYGAYNSLTNPVPIGINGSGGAAIKGNGLIEMESSSIYWASGSANGRLGVVGWTDYYSAG